MNLQTFLEKFASSSHLQRTELAKELASLNVDSLLANYITPGLLSLLCDFEDRPARMFISTRHEHDAVAPHNHRFGFTSYVLLGSVEQTLWLQNNQKNDTSDRFMKTVLVYSGAPGEYQKSPGGLSFWSPTKIRYQEGSVYRMEQDKVHSIRFSKGAVVVIVEDLGKTDSSFYLEPFVLGEHIKTAETQPWMFLK